MQSRIKKLFSGNIDRTQFLYGQLLLANIALLLLSVWVVLYAYISVLMLENNSDFFSASGKYTYLMSFQIQLIFPILIFLLWIFFSSALGVRRAHDLGKSKRWNLWLLFPPTLLYLTFAPGRGQMTGNIIANEEASMLKSIIFPLIYSVAVFVFFFFRWIIEDIVWIFIYILDWAVYFSILSFMTWSVLSAVQNKLKNWKIIIPPAFGIITILLVIYFPFTSAWINWNFKYHFSERQKVVEMVKAGELTLNTPYNSGLIQLPDSFGALSIGGNEIVVTREENSFQVLFYTFRGVVDNYSGFVYIEKEGEPDQSDFPGDTLIDIEKMADHWYFVAFS